MGPEGRGGLSASSARGSVSVERNNVREGRKEAFSGTVMKFLLETVGCHG